MSFRVHVPKVVRNLTSDISRWKFVDPDYPCSYTLTFTKDGSLNEMDCLWKVEIQRDGGGDFDVDIVSIQLFDSCDNSAPNCHSSLYNERQFGLMPFYIYLNGVGQTFASNWNGYLTLQIERFFIVKPELEI